MRHLLSEGDFLRNFRGYGPLNTMMDQEQAELISQLIADNQQRLSGYIRTLVPQRADAEDVRQEVNLFLWRHGHEFQPGTNFAAWAYQIARNHVLSHRKRVCRSKLRFSDEVVNHLAAEATADIDFAEPRLRALERCLRKLGESDQALVRMRYEPDATTQSVAERFGRPIKGVYRSLSRIRAALLQCIERTLAREAQP
jgi:RNA polymerase sigma-70 factor (ECF subfamily)